MIKKILGPFKEKVLFVDHLQADFFKKKNSILFIDDHLKDVLEIKELDLQFEVYWLKAGEDLKSIDTLKKVLFEIESLLENLAPPYCFVAIGGGSVGDFCGFLSSIYHRGVDFIQCPTTWLAAVDSAHGGKTALNVLGFKNQVGSFYPAKKIIVSKSLLSRQNPKEAFGEITKTILLSSPTSKLRSLISKAKQTDIETTWNYLSEFVKVKNTYVKKDPKEKKKERFKLNLGHTVGHAFEKIYNIPHSEAVLRGVLFTVMWSVKKKYAHIKVLNLLMNFIEVNQFVLKPLPAKNIEIFKSAILKDKKRMGEEINYVFVKGLKAAVKKVSVIDILAELKEQGWIKK